MFLGVEFSDHQTNCQPEAFVTCVDELANVSLSMHIKYDKIVTVYERVLILAEELGCKIVAENNKVGFINYVINAGRKDVLYKESTEARCHGIFANPPIGGKMSFSALLAYVALAKTLSNG